MYLDKFEILLVSYFIDKSLSTGPFCLCATLEKTQLWEYNFWNLSDFEEAYWRRETRDLWYYCIILFILVGTRLRFSKFTVFYENYGFIVYKL